MLNIPTWLLSDSQLIDLIATWRATINDVDATPADAKELAAFDALVAYAEERGARPKDAYIVHGATL